MRLLWGILGLLLLTLPLHADEVDYTLTVVNAPGIGDFSWEIQADGFIQAPPSPVYQCMEYCNETSEHWVHQCVEYCDAAADTNNFFTSFVAMSEPSNGGGCSISAVYLAPNYSLDTYFSPLCDSLFDGNTSGVLPDPGTYGTWTWDGTNPDNTQNVVTLAIADPPGATVPEPETSTMLWIGLIGLALMKFAPRGKRPLAN